MTTKPSYTIRITENGKTRTEGRSMYRASLATRVRELRLKGVDAEIVEA